MEGQKEKKGEKTQKEKKGEKSQNYKHRKEKTIAKAMPIHPGWILNRELKRVLKTVSCKSFCSNI